jgi:hypothetical protein
MLRERAHELRRTANELIEVVEHEQSIRDDGSQAIDRVTTPSERHAGGRCDRGHRIDGRMRRRQINEPGPLRFIRRAHDPARATRLSNPRSPEERDDARTLLEVPQRRRDLDGAPIERRALGSVRHGNSPS